MVVIYVLSYIGLSVLAGFRRGILGAKVLDAVNLGLVIIGSSYLIWSKHVYPPIATILSSRS